MFWLIRGIFLFSALFLGPWAFSASESSKKESSSFFDLFKWEEKPAPSPSSPPAPKKSAQGEEGADEGFAPSLSETLSDTARLKNKMKRQLAKEIDTGPKRFPAKQNPQRGLSQSASGEMARFGDFEISISERTEEELTKPKK